MSDRRTRKATVDTETDEAETEPAEGTEEAAAPAEPEVAYEAKVIDPPPDVEEGAPAPDTEEAPLDVPAGHVAIVYRGDADIVEHGEYKFRPGKPVAVPSETAEELLTIPFEVFEQV